MEITFDKKQFVVLDIGSGYIKAGFSGDDMPRCVIRTVLGEHEEVIEDQTGDPSSDQQKKKKTYQHGNKVYDERDKKYTLYEPVRRGLVETDSDMEHLRILIERIFKSELETESRKADVLITQSPFNDK